MKKYLKASESWDSCRVYDLLNYFCDDPKYDMYDDDQLMDLIYHQMEAEHSVLPTNKREFIDAFYSAMDRINEAYWEEHPDELDFGDPFDVYNDR